MINKYVTDSPEARSALLSPEAKHVWIDGETTVVYTGEHTPPGLEPGVPQVVSMRQARLALLDAGLLTSVQAVVDVAPQGTKIAWEYATELGRSDPLVITLAASLSPPLTATQIDGLFMLASLK